MQIELNKSDPPLELQIAEVSKLALRRYLKELGLKYSWKKGILIIDGEDYYLQFITRGKKYE